MKSWAPMNLNVGLVVGVLFVLLTYLVLSQQAATSGLSVAATVAQWIMDRHLTTNGPGETFVASDVQRTVGKQLIQGSGVKGKVVYNTNGSYSETCEVDGDVRINSTALSVTLVPAAASSSSSSPERREWRIFPYSRRNMPGIKAVTVTQLDDSAAAAAPACTATYAVPAVLFALGGLTGNFWHDFGDVLVPLFVASRRYEGDVQLLITNARPSSAWWPAAYAPILRRLSKYDPVDLDAADAAADGGGGAAGAQVLCFPHVTVGIKMHNALSIVPDWAPGPRGSRLSMADFTSFMREVYALPRHAPSPASKTRRPRLMLVHRGHSRRIVNEEEVLAARAAAGFDAAAAEFRRDDGVDAQARAANAADALVGVHGAGLTSAVFLPPGGVLIQVVPYGKMEGIATLEFGLPAREMGLRYLDYVVSKEESTLLELLGPEHPAVRDPESIHRAGWDKMTEFYLDMQDVRIDVERFKPVLAQAFDLQRQR